MAILGNRRKFGGIDFLDVTFVMILLMSWLFFANAWKDPAANTMLGVTVVILVFYLFAKYLGIFPFLELTKPYWTISALLSIPVWYLTFIILPQPAGTFAAQDIVPNMLEFFVSPEIATSILQSWNFGLTEGLLAGILLAFFIGVAKKRSLGNQRKQRFNIIAVILLVAIFMSSLHITFAVALAKAGVFEPGILFGHQILSFGIMLIAAIFLPMVGIIALLSPHVVKNLIAFNAPSGVWIGSFLIFIVFDILSYYFGQKKEKSLYKKQVSNFIK